MEQNHIPQHLIRSRRVKRKRAGAKVAALAVCLVLLVLMTGTTIGRYQHEFNSDGSVRAKEFYFTSNFLDGSTHTLAPGSTEVTFTLGNHTDELRCSEVDIAYVVTVEPSNGVTVAYNNDVNDDKKLPLGDTLDDTVTLTGLTPGTYTIKATGTGTVGAAGTGGYTGTLTAQIEVLPVEGAVYKYLDTSNSEYVLLTVWAQGYKGNVEIQPPVGLIPDNTDPVMRSLTTDGTPFTDATSFNTGGNAEGYASHTYRFFGDGVTAEDFTVTYDGGGTAAEKDPS